MTYFKCYKGLYFRCINLTALQQKCNFAYTTNQVYYILIVPDQLVRYKTCKISGVVL